MKRFTTLCAGLVTLLLVALATVSEPLRPAAAQTPPVAPEPQSRSITVRGQGQVSARPDQAVVRIGVTTEASQPDEALAQNNAQTGQVLQQLDELGIARADIKTGAVRLVPIREPAPQAEQSPAISGYRATNTLVNSVRLSGAAVVTWEVGEVEQQNTCEE